MSDQSVSDEAMFDQAIPGSSVSNGTGSDRLGFFESVAANINGFMYRTEPLGEFRVAEMTPGVMGLLGYPASDFVRTNKRKFEDIIHPDDIALTEIPVEAAIKNRSRWDMEYRLIASDGRAVRVRETGSAVFDVNGDIQYLEGVILDASDIWNERTAADEWRSGIEAIMQHAQSITKVLGSLKLLALNARIEAARAGNAGRSFSVVADEMRKLSSDAEQVVSKIEKERDNIFKKVAA
jgi:hypothetical protein